MPGQHIPTPELEQKVSELARAGYNHDSIAMYIGISDETLRKYYSNHMTKARFDLVATALTHIAARVEKGDIKMCCWVATHLGEIAQYQHPQSKTSQLTQAVLEKLMDRL